MVKYLTIVSRMLRASCHLVFLVLLTVLTQIGGIAYLIGLALNRLFCVRFATNRFLIIVASYSVLSAAAVFFAPAFGRVSLPCYGDGPLMSQSPIYCVLNRQYVSPEMFEIAESLANQMVADYPGTQTLTLDANFPFFNGFPLLPHLSHDDGEKLDIAFYYQSDETYVPDQTLSPIGYWGFEQPREGDPLPCGSTSGPTLRWDMQWFEWFHADVTLEPGRTRAALLWLATEGERLGVTKIFVEPHLQTRLNIQDDNIRFQGCRAARHDDHIHIQL